MCITAQNNKYVQNNMKANTINTPINMFVLLYLEWPQTFELERSSQQLFSETSV